MDSLHNILSHKDFEEPPEITAIKRYIERHFQAQVTITVQEQRITIVTKSAALAGTLRIHSPQLKEVAATDKQLVIRIGA